MKKIILSTLLYFLVSNSFSQAFITTWNTGTDNYIVIPGYGTNYNIQWEEIGNSSHNGSQLGTNKTTVSFGTPGNYRVRISGGSPAFNRICFTNDGTLFPKDYEKLRTVEDWGNIVWSSFENAFRLCVKLVSVPTVNPIWLPNTSCSDMFAQCTSFNLIPIYLITEFFIFCLYITPIYIITENNIHLKLDGSRTIFY